MKSSHYLSSGSYRPSYTSETLFSWSTKTRDTHHSVRPHPLLVLYSPNVTHLRPLLATEIMDRVSTACGKDHSSVALTQVNILQVSDNVL